MFLLWLLLLLLLLCCKIWQNKAYFIEEDACLPVSCLRSAFLNITILSHSTEFIRLFKLYSVTV
jgi:hypothetical protein